MGDNKPATSLVLDTDSTTNTTEDPVRPNLLKLVAVIASILLVLFICVLTFVFVIPNTNIFRFSEAALETLE